MHSTKKGNDCVIISDGELRREATAEESSVVQTEGGRHVRRKVTFYNLDAILAVGYRVRSPRGAQFRRWATTVLAEYLGLQTRRQSVERELNVARLFLKTNPKLLFFQPAPCWRSSI
jgi:hypothetical protein